jgi:hypothetical protein
MIQTDNPDDEARKIQIEIYRRMSPAEKWQQAVNLRKTAWSLKKAGICALHPDWSEQKIENTVKEIFLNATT